MRVNSARMRVHVWLLAALVPVVTAGFFDRMMARYRDRREQRQEARLRPLFPDYHDELQHLIAENAAHMADEHHEYAVGVPVSGDHGERGREARQLHRGRTVRGSGQRGEAAHASSSRPRVRQERSRGEEEPSGARGAGTLLFGRRRRPPGRPRQRPPPTPAPTPTTPPTVEPPHRIHLPTAIDGFDGLPPPTRPTRRPAAYIGPHGRIVLRPREEVTVEPTRRPRLRPRPPSAEHSAVPRPSISEHSSVPRRPGRAGGCAGGRLCADDEEQVESLPRPLPPPPRRFRQRRIRPQTTTQQPPRVGQRNTRPTHRPPPTTKHPSSTREQSSTMHRQPLRTTPMSPQTTPKLATTTERPPSVTTESLPGGTALFEAMTSVLDTARVAMLAMMPHVQQTDLDLYGTKLPGGTTTPSSEYINVSSSPPPMPAEPLVGQDSTEHSGNFAMQTATQRSDLQREETSTNHPTVPIKDTRHRLQPQRGNKHYVENVDEQKTRWEDLLEAAGEDDLEVMYGMLERARENREIVGRTQSRERFGFQGRSPDEKKIRHERPDTEVVEPPFGDTFTKVKTRKDPSLIRTELAAIIAALELESEAKGQDRVVKTGQLDWKPELSSYSREQIIALNDDRNPQRSVRDQQVHKEYHTGSVATHSGGRRFPQAEVPSSYEVSRLRPGKEHLREGSYNSGIGDVQLHSSTSGLNLGQNDDGNSKYSHGSLPVRHQLDERYSNHDKFPQDGEHPQGKGFDYSRSKTKLNGGTNNGSGELRNSHNYQLSDTNTGDDTKTRHPGNSRFIWGPSELHDYEDTTEHGDTLYDDSIDARLRHVDEQDSSSPAYRANLPSSSLDVKPSTGPREGAFPSRPSHVRDYEFDSGFEYEKERENVDQERTYESIDRYRYRKQPNATQTEDLRSQIIDGQALSDPSLPISDDFYKAGPELEHISHEALPETLTSPEEKPITTSPESSRTSPQSIPGGALLDLQIPNKSQQYEGRREETTVGRITSHVTADTTTAHPREVVETSTVTPSTTRTTWPPAMSATAPPTIPMAQPVPVTAAQQRFSATFPPATSTTVQPTPLADTQPTSRTTDQPTNATTTEQMSEASALPTLGTFAQPTLPSPSSTVAQSALGTTSRPSLEETKLASMTLEELVQLLNQMKQEKHDDVMGTSARTITTTSMESTTEEPITKYPHGNTEKTIKREDEFELIEQGDSAHPMPSKEKENMQTKPMETTTMKHIGIVFPDYDYEDEDVIQPEDMEDTREIDGEMSDESFPITAIPIENRETPYIGSLPPPPTVPMASHQHQSTDAGLTHAVTTESTPETMTWTPQPVATSVSGQSSTTSDTSSTIVTTSDFPHVGMSPTSGNLKTPAPGLRVPETYAIPTSSDWLMPPTSVAGDETMWKDEDTTLPTLLEAVAVPTVDYWFSTEEFVPSRSTTAVSSDPKTTSSKPTTARPKITTTSSKPTTTSTTTTPTTKTTTPTTTTTITTTPTTTTTRITTTTATSTTTTIPTTTTSTTTTTKTTTPTTITTTATTTRPTTTTTTSTTTSTTITTTTTTPTTITTTPTTTTTTTTPTTTTTTQTTTTTTTTNITTTTTATTSHTTHSSTSPKTTQVTSTKPEEVTTRPLSLLEQVMTRSVPFTLKRRRYTTPTPVKTATTEPEPEPEPALTISSSRDPSSAMPKPIDQTTTNPGLDESSSISSSSDLEDATPETSDAEDEEDDEDALITQSPLPEMSPELRLALVRELLKQMQAAKQSKKEKAKQDEAEDETETEVADEEDATEGAIQNDDMQATDEPTKAQATTEQPAETPPEDKDEDEDSDSESDERSPSPTEEEINESRDDSETLTQIEASETVSESPEQEPKEEILLKILEKDVKVDEEVKSEAQQLAALLKGDDKDTSVTEKPEESTENKEPVTPSAFLLKLRERVKKRPSIRESRRRSKPKPRKRAKIRKSLPLGPRPSWSSEEEETDEQDEDEDDEDYLEEEEDTKEPVEKRTKLHQLVNAELNGRPDKNDAEDLSDQDPTPAETKVREKKEVRAHQDETVGKTEDDAKEKHMTTVMQETNTNSQEAPASETQEVKPMSENENPAAESHEEVSSETVLNDPENDEQPLLQNPDAKLASQMQTEHAEESPDQPDAASAEPPGDSSTASQEDSGEQAEREPDAESKEPDRQTEDMKENETSEDSGISTDTEAPADAPEAEAI